MKALLASLGMATSLLVAPAHALIISEFTGDDIEMSFEFADVATGVQITAAITSSSTETGDIRALWLGLNDSLFNPLLILAEHVSVSSPSFGLINPATVDLGGGDNLTGGAGIFALFDLDIAIQQLLRPDQTLDSLIVSITTPGLLASYFEEAGARVRSSTGDDGSSKLIGGQVTTVPEPSTLALLGLGLLAVGYSVRRRQRLLG
jgi:hypothetical protein